MQTIKQIQIWKRRLQSGTKMCTNAISKQNRECSKRKKVLISRNGPGAVLIAVRERGVKCATL